MNFFTLPKSMRLGSDLMAKATINDPNAINIISTALLNVQNDYTVGNSEWDNGTRSDIVLEPKSLASDLPHDLTISNFPGCYEFPAKGWANNCLVLCKIRVQGHTGTVPINPFIALGLFLTSRALDINDTLCRNDPNHSVLTLFGVTKTPKSSSPEQVAKAIKDLQNQNYALKRKYNDTIGEAFSSISTSISTATATTNPTSIENIDFTVESITPYERSMTFVENYVETRKQKGFKRMNWLVCYSKGIELNLF
ncbi:hypothetical protein G6F66_009339 [Rhizopus arrhizus]|nr:hypothetical protein G6F66_009339 [Rhizopus arrhizus]